MFRRLLFLASAVLVVVSGVPAGGQTDRAIDVIKVSGPLDERAVDFAIGTIEKVSSTSALIIIQLDSSAALTERLGEVAAIVADPPTPLTVWVGPETAVAYGGPVHLLALAPLGLAAPGVKIGAGDPVHFGARRLLPQVYGSEEALLGASLLDTRVTVEVPIEGVVDDVYPSLSNVVQGLDGRTVIVRGVEQEISITEPFDEEGVEGRRPIPTRFHEPGFVDRGLRLTLSPAVAYLFVLIGLSIAAFEFYAAGVGVAAAVAVLTLALSGYGITVLPVNWWALAVGVLGLGLYLFDFQRIQLRLASVLGTVAMLVGARYFVHEPPQLSMAWWSAVLIVLSVALFFLFAMTTVVRARFSTPTIGREHLIGMTGTAETAVAPEGVVLVDGARWKANSRRASGIEPGDEITVAAVEGFVLAVDPVE